MKYLLVNPNWDFTGSTYFGCRDPHVPLELMFAHDQIQRSGHEPLLIDAHTSNLTIQEVKRRADAFVPNFLVIPTAPSYLFWRCPPPELRVPQNWFAGIGGKAVKVAIGPHASATPAATLKKTNCDIAMRGEPDQTLCQLANLPWKQIKGCCFRHRDSWHMATTFGMTEMKDLKALDFSNYQVEAHGHRHQVFSGEGRGAELEFARGCPWACTFCNKTLFRNQYRERSVDVVLREVDTLISRGVSYIYFIDEIFGIGTNIHELLEGLSRRPIEIGFQSRIDLWNEETLDLLGRAHCISMECGIEAITHQGREELNKNCRISTDRISQLLIYAKERIAWVQANLILTVQDNREQIRAWQDRLKNHGVWVSEPVPMFPFPGSPLYAKTFGELPDDYAWERAHHYYTSAFREKGYSDIQEQEPAAIEDLECTF